MQFNELVIENFRVYHQKQIIKFQDSGDSDQNIILIGGLNGSGKTSILTSVNLLLYGLDSEQKENLVGTLNHNYYDQGGDSAKLQLKMTVDDSKYRIIGYLKYKKNNKVDHFKRELYKDGKKLNTTEESIQTFINRKIPKDVSSFFLFDGEKIQSLVEQQEKGNLKAPIQEIVALEFFKTLSNDVGKVKKSLERKYSKLAKPEKIKHLSSEIEKKEDEIELLQNKVEKTTERLKNAQAKKIEFQNQKNEKVKYSSKSREDLSKEIARMEERIDSINTEIENFSREQLPLLILKPVINNVKDRLELEEEHTKAQERVKLNYEDFDTFMTSFLEDAEQEVQLTEEQKQVLFAKGRKNWGKVKKFNEYQEPDDIEIIHDLNKREKQIINRFELQDKDLVKLIDEKTKLEEKLKSLNAEYSSAPEIIDTAMEDEEIQKFTKLIKEYESERGGYREELYNHDSELKRLKKQFSHAREQLNENSNIDKQLNLAEKAHNAAEKFVKEMTYYKAKCIKEDFEDIIAKLLRKNDDIISAEFDVEDYKLKAYNSNGNQVQLSNRSAGEKQIIALGLIWALTQNAYVDLPYIIDTPLGRLDSLHRKHLVEHFFPKLSNQVVILSTDTEVNEELQTDLHDNIYKTYNLNYDFESRSTTIEEGYFNFGEVN